MRWVKVSMRELERVWKSLARRRICYNGCTNAELCRIYGAENIRHKMGVGWFKRVAR